MLISNDRQAVAEVASYLQSLGHQRIGYIAGPRGFMSARERREGFVEALEKRGLRIPEAMIVEGGYTYESGLAGAEILLSRSPRPTAIFASNDEMAAGVYRAARDLGLDVPRDLSVVGFDDGPIAGRLSPPLTTVRLPIRDIGRMAAGKLIAPDPTCPSRGRLVQLVDPAAPGGARLLPAAARLTQHGLESRLARAGREPYDTGYQSARQPL